MAKANVRCSIELEPKTLNQGQLHRAREVAADVVQRLEPNQASLVLIDMVERLKPMNVMIQSGRELPSQPIRDNKEGIKRCQCSYISIDSPNQLQMFKEPVSAPF